MGQSRTATERVTYTLRDVPWSLWKGVRAVADDKRQTVATTVIEALTILVATHKRTK